LEKAQPSTILPILGFALAGLTGCTDQTRAARTAAELADEVRVIAAVARSELSPGRTNDSFCVARRIEASASLDSLPTTNLAEFDGTVNEAAERARSATVEGRTLADADLAGEVAREDLGTSCSGNTFLSFYRIQFSGDVAIAFVNSRRTCGRGMAAYRLRRSGANWLREDMRVLSHADDFACREGETEDRAGFFRIREGGVTDDQLRKAASGTG